MKAGSTIAACLALALASPAGAQQWEHQPRPKGEVLHGYLASAPVDYHGFLPGPPAPDSPEDMADMAVIAELQAKATPERRRMAEADDAAVYPRFEAAFGSTIDRATTPMLVRLLNNSLRDLRIPVFDAKKAYQRLRPYQRTQLAYVCGEATPPKPDLNATERSSFPSGHSAYGWTTAMVLAQVAPDHAQAVLDKAQEYGFSRLVCGVHFPSDVAAGRQAATAVVTQLLNTPAFQADLACAKAEHAGAPLPEDCRHD